jgi:5'-nucleotidase
VDQDGVLADWGKTWDKTLALYGASYAIPRHANQRSFDLKTGLNSDDKAMVNRVMETPGFYADLEPIPGAVKALKEMLADGHDIAIVTSPYYSNPTCIADKIEWVRRNLGQSWVSRIILAADKTRVSGDVLIDDKPAITGARIPDWEHVLFDQPYNHEVVGKRRMYNWNHSEWWLAINPLRVPAGSKAFA